PPGSERDRHAAFFPASAVSGGPGRLVFQSIRDRPCPARKRWNRMWLFHLWPMPCMDPPDALQASAGPPLGSEPPRAPPPPRPQFRRDFAAMGHGAGDALQVGLGVIRQAHCNGGQTAAIGPSTGETIASLASPTCANAACI